MTTINPFMGKLLYVLSFVYVNVWVPIRLTYLRLKFRIKPHIRIVFETGIFVAIVLSSIPAGFMIIGAKTIEYLALLWLRFTCMFVDMVLGNEIGSFYEDIIAAPIILSDEALEIDVVEEDIPLASEVKTNIPEPEVIEEQVHEE